MYPFAKIEKKWSKKWLGSGLYELDLKKAKKPFYNLMMFPYPSAEGLHVGNVYAFIGSDVYGRLKRMKGYDVFEPIGLDGFGIHSENYALKVGKHPAEQSKISEKRFYGQLQGVGNGFAWEKHLETYDVEYYRWTQWIFVQMWKQGLAYRKKASVNWCPSCKTVLADEQVINGECERCGTQVTKKELEQWFFKITKYAENLLRGLDKIDWPEHIKTAQRNWIGKSEGWTLKFPIVGSKEKIEVFTTRADTILGATYMALAPEHPLVEKFMEKLANKKAVKGYVKQSKTKTENDRIAEGGAKVGVELKGIKALNPATGKEISVWLSDYIIMSYGTGAIMAVPAYDERDEEFAKRYKLPVVKAKLVNPAKIAKKIEGEKTTHYHLRDWLISRQRYWGPPIPMIFCEKCGWQAVPEKDLPVLLPETKDFRPKGTEKGPLASIPGFYQTKCPSCKGPAIRETDVSDTFLDSAWYFYRYLDSENKKEIFGKELVKKWLPVDMYIGGTEHAVLHLLYSRFLAMVFKKMGLVDFEEPFSVLRSHGLLISEGAKMSKSRGNVVVPDKYINDFGADTLRMYLMFLGPYQEGGDWRDSGMMGIVRFLNRTFDYYANVKTDSSKSPSRWMHAHVKKVGQDIEGLKYNTAISELMVVLRCFEEKKVNGRKDLEAFLLLLAPFAPFLTEELWEKLGNKYSVHKQPWPKYDVSKLT
ncbi:MAG: class I tRNA ligase family protein [Candidatus Harrisonbacteria bacterium]|nr:class I tRNA ligase family protein [Candidatus Harrisonbacteria bacterium]